MTRIARIETPARLHFGFLRPSPSDGRVYGGVGVGVDRPGAVVEAEPRGSVDVSMSESLEHPERQRRRVEGYVESALDLYEGEGAAVRVVEALPLHRGFGSGTQTALAVAEAVALAHGESFDAVEAAEHLGRGRRSGVGVAVYGGGGFVVDSGYPTGSQDGVPAAAVRQEVPEGWRFVVAPGHSAAVHGEEEDKLLEKVTDVSSYEAWSLNSLYEDVVCGVAEGDVEVFGRGVQALGEMNGDVYVEADVQEDRYVRPEVVARLKELPEVYGVGQSSWGPSIYALTTQEHANDVAGLVEDGFVARPDSTGAVSRVIRRRI